MNQLKNITSNSLKEENKMKELFVSYLYKLRHDLAFRITLIIGGGLSVLMFLIYLGLSAILKSNILSGSSLLIASLSPVQNFGLAVPINLITFTVLEFNHGSIRNKIIAGHSKASIYTSLFLNGLLFTFVLIGLYALLNFGLGSIGSLIKFGDGNNDLGPLLPTNFADGYIWKMIVLAVFSYISIVSFTVFFATLFRNIGPSIPVVIVGLLICYLAATIVSAVALIEGKTNETVLWIGRIVDPLYGIGASEAEPVYKTINGQQVITGQISTVTNETFISSICSNVFYAALFYGFGLLIFTKRDIK